MIRRPPAGHKPPAPSKEPLPQGTSAPGYSPKEYWDRLAASSGANEAQARAAVLHPGAPDWFNRTIDRLQARAWSRAIGHCGLARGARVLDVACGTGRWLARLEQAGMAPTGTDRAEAMLQIARRRVPGSALVAAEARQLPFADASFDCVLAVTVVQHIPWEEQAQALREMTRVLRPGACLVLLELIRGKDRHIFPRTPQHWIELGSAASIQTVCWFGQEFLIFDRLFRRVALAIRGPAPQGDPAPLPGQATGEKRGLARRLYWMGRRLAVLLAVWAEPLAERLCPQSFAAHGVFVFRKSAGGA